MDGFDTPKTVTAIADGAGLNPRYVQEWLGVMVCGGVVELTTAPADEDTFLLPKAHGDLITRRAGNSNMGVYTQEIPLLTECAMEQVVQAFYSGDGVHYDHYPKFQNFMTQLADVKHQQTLIAEFLPSVDDGKILRAMASGIRVCDLGCAEGIALILMAEAFPHSRFTGIDISPEVIRKAEACAQRRGICNATFLHLDAATLTDNRDLAQSFDYVTAFDAVHDQIRPLDVLKGVFSILKPGGLFSMVDIAAGSHLGDNKEHPMGPFLYTVSLMHCMPVGLVNGGAGLGMMWGRQHAVKLLHRAGFKEIEVLEIPKDPFNLHFQGKKP